MVGCVLRVGVWGCGVVALGYEEGGGREGAG